MRTIKYLIAFILGMLFITGNAFALNLLVTSPNDGDVLFVGNNHPITWDYTGPANKQVRLELLKYGSVIGTITQNVQASDKTYTWKIGDYVGGKATPGSGYQIRVSIIDGIEWAVNNGTFTIFSSMMPPLQKQKPKPTFRREMPEVQLLPDLVIKQVNPNSQQGPVSKLMVLIANLGGSVPTSRTCLRVYRIVPSSQLPGFTFEDAGELQLTTAELQQDQERWETFNLGIEDACVFEITADCGNALNESNEKNNVYQWDCISRTGRNVGEIAIHPKP